MNRCHHFVKKYSWWSVIAGVIFLLTWPAAWAANPAPKTGAAAEKPKTAKGADSPQSGAPLNLSSVRLGTMSDYSRLVFTFNQPMENYTVRRADVDEVWLDFGPAQTKNQGRLNLQDVLLEGVAVLEENGRLQARIKSKTPRFTFRHFVSPDKISIVVDLRSTSNATPDGSTEQIDVSVPGPEIYARTVRESLPEQPKPNSPEAIMAKATDEILEEKYAAAGNLLKKLKSGFPNSPLGEPATILQGDIAYFTDPKDLTPQFNNITTAYQEAINNYPANPEIPRVKLMLGLTNMKSEYTSEAIGYFKLVIQDHPQSRLALIAKGYLGEIYTKTGKKDLAKEYLEAVLAQHPKGELALKSSYYLGQTYFQNGLYTQAIEMFRDIIYQDDKFYLQHPEILNYMGEAYFKSNRFDLARSFLYHSLNLDPDQKNADLIMVRIAETYKEEQKHDMAAGVYALVRKVYPETPGAMISSVRLAEYGSLHHLLTPQVVFGALEEGAPSTALKIYKKVVETEQQSPLIELATYKMAEAYLDMEEYKQALNIFQEMVIQYPRSTLMPEIKSGMNLALVNLGRALYITKKYDQFIPLLTENQLQVSEEFRPELRHYLAMSYAAVGNQAEAVRTWQANKDYKEHLDERSLGLGRAYLNMDRLSDAVKYLTDFRKNYPDNPQVASTLVDQGLKEYKLGLEDAALSHFEEAIRLSPTVANDAQLMKSMGYMYLKKGNTGGGLSTLKKALDLLKDQPDAQPDIFLIYSNLGQAYTNDGRKEEAEQNLDAAIKSRPKDPPPETLYVIAGAYKKLGLPEKYKSTMELLLKSNSPLWRDVANKELKPAPIDPKVNKLLESGGTAPQETQPAPKAGDQTPPKTTTEKK
ncbi:MAG: tetratricopeptide repeat protein [Deltaproteobacteria bacterium]|nr:tetratricopeptide repeat protein [Deltaproteobacteria bacterium]